MKLKQVQVEECDTPLHPASFLGQLALLTTAKCILQGPLNCFPNSIFLQESKPLLTYGAVTPEGLNNTCNLKKQALAISSSPVVSTHCVASPMQKQNLLQLRLRRLCGPEKLPNLSASFLALDIFCMKEQQAKCHKAADGPFPSFSPNLCPLH